MRALELEAGFSVSVPKEPFFFWPEMGKFCGPQDQNREILTDEVQYEAAFARSAPEALQTTTCLVDGSQYVLHEQAIDRIRTKYSHAKFIIVVREPLTRALSSYAHLVRDGFETRSFAECLQLESVRHREGWGPLYWLHEASDYAKRIEHVVSSFGANNVLVVSMDTLVSGWPEVKEAISQLVGVPLRNDSPFPLTNVSKVEKNPLVTSWFEAVIPVLRRVSRSILPSDVSAKAGHIVVQAYRRTNFKKPQASGAYIEDLFGPLAERYRDVINNLGLRLGVEGDRDGHAAAQ